MGYWRPNAASLPAIKRYVIDFDDNTIPVMTYLRSSDYGEFDPYMAFLRTSNDQHIGHADFIEVYASIGFFGKRIRRRYFGFEFGPIEWARESVTVNRTVFVTELRLPSGRVHEAHRISQQFGHTRLNVAGKTISEQNDQLRRWSQPFVTAALDVRDFREQMIAGSTQVALFIDKIPSTLTRVHYETVCRGIKLRPLSDVALYAVKGGDRLPRRFPEVTPEAAIEEMVHFLRQVAINQEQGIN